SMDCDISCGGIGASRGYTTALIRTKLGLQLVNKARSAGYITEGDLPNMKLVRKIAKIKVKKQKRGN
ncbi:hypothetical protein GF325_10110, partial [Candidatus Bathyarchaeota archaeon]|nr:hypothetical protein [Candidatus Bathyarchaeota archaeon]